MEEKIEISMLLRIYGNLLTDKQQQFMDYYYNDDLSLSEIAENEEITRQAVREILLKSKNKLKEYEEKLGFMKKENKIKELIEELVENPNQEKKLAEIRKLLNN